jgi:two-component system, NarL family, sensor histidine kinase DesK
LVGAVAFPGFAEATGSDLPLGLPVATLFGAATTAALSPLLPTPALVGVVLAGVVPVLGWLSPSGSIDDPLPAAAFYAAQVGFVAFTYRSSAWMISLIWEIDRARTAEARLAVAEERLRFARDLHDVLGRNLSLVAVKSELAGQLARRGDPSAVAQMLEVRQVAHDSLREMREVVGGYRSADLHAELAGAQAVLRSAGVTCRVIGDGTGLSRAAQAALGWVVREATTNVIRHSEASTCTIELDVLDQAGAERVAVLRMVNDGVRPPPAGAPAGTGLIGLGERLAGVGGRLVTAERLGRRFVVEARLPVSRVAVVTEPAP